MNAILLLLGIAVFGGMLGAWIFQRLRIPQVIGYIAIGVLLGESGLELFHLQDIEDLQPLNIFALGIIGFLVGGELRIDEFKKYGRQFASILFGEGIAAFILVGGAIGVFLYCMGIDLYISIAGGMVFGAIASATDPASTVDVLWEYRSKGVLTTSITAIVALDDALAMALYGIGTGAAQILTGSEASILHELGVVAFELFGAIILGGAFAAILVLLMRWFHNSDKSLPFALGILLLVIGISDITGMDVILAAMTTGFAAANLAPLRTKRLFSLVKSFSTPIYVLFFVFVGARLGLGRMPGWLWWVVGLYVIGRSLGKFAGAWIGAKITNSEDVVRKYLGTGLFCQGGVAVGLSIMASKRLGEVPLTADLSLGDAVIYGITATTLIVQILGPSAVKMAISNAGEAGRNVTDEDVIKDLTVSEVMMHNFKPILEGESLEAAVGKFSNGEYLVYPVINNAGIFCGTVSLASMREVIAERETWQWLIIQDVMEHSPITVTEKMPLDELLDLLEVTEEEHLPVIDSVSNKPVGMLRRGHIRKRIADEVLRRSGGTPALTI